MIDQALDAICRRVKKNDRKHDIPYLAGYSLDGKTIYIDRRMPPNHAAHSGGGSELCVVRATVRLWSREESYTQLRRDDRMSNCSSECTARSRQVWT
jgi:hypothetical protein